MTVIVPGFSGLLTIIVSWKDDLLEMQSSTASQSACSQSASIKVIVTGGFDDDKVKE